MENKASKKPPINVADIIILSVAVVLSVVIVFANLSPKTINSYIDVENTTYYLSDDQVKLYVYFRNSGSKQIESVDFEVRFYDANGNELDKTTIRHEGKLASGKSIAVWKNLTADGYVYSIDAKVTSVNITYSDNTNKFINCSYEFIKGEG